MQQYLWNSGDGIVDPDNMLVGSLSAKTNMIHCIIAYLGS